MGAPNERTVANWYSFLKYKTTPAVSLLPAISVRGALFSNGRNGGGDCNNFVLIGCNLYILHHVFINLQYMFMLDGL